MSARAGYRAATGKRRRVRRAGLVVVLGLELAFVGGLIVSVGSALPSHLPRASAPAPALAVDTVAGHPHAYTGRDIAVEGVVGERPRRRAARDRWAFLLEGHGHRLYVVADRGHPLTLFRPGTRVVVHGRLTVPRHRKHRPRASRAAVAHRAHAAGILAAERISLAR